MAVNIMMVAGGSISRVVKVEWYIKLFLGVHFADILA